MSSKGIKRKSSLSEDGVTDVDTPIVGVLGVSRTGRVRKKSTRLLLLEAEEADDDVTSPRSKRRKSSESASTTGKISSPQTENPDESVIKHLLDHPKEEQDLTLTLTISSADGVNQNKSKKKKSLKKSKNSNVSSDSSKTLNFVDCQVNSVDPTPTVSSGDQPDLDLDLDLTIDLPTGDKAPTEPYVAIKEEGLKMKLILSPKAVTASNKKKKDWNTLMNSATESQLVESKKTKKSRRKSSNPDTNVIQESITDTGTQTHIKEEFTPMYDFNAISVKPELSADDVKTENSSVSQPTVTTPDTNIVSYTDFINEVSQAGSLEKTKSKSKSKKKKKIVEQLEAEVPKQAQHEKPVKVIAGDDVNPPVLAVGPEPPLPVLVHPPPPHPVPVAAVSDLSQEQSTPSQPAKKSKKNSTVPTKKLASKKPATEKKDSFEETKKKKERLKIERERKRQEKMELAHKAKMEKVRKRPPTAYTLWTSTYRSKVMLQNPGLDFANVSKRLGEIWHGLPEKEKRDWKRKAKRLAGKAAPWKSYFGGYGTNSGNFVIPKGVTLTKASKRRSPDILSAAGIGKSKQTRPMPMAGIYQSKPIQMSGTEVLDIAAHLKLLSESLGLLGVRLQEHKGPIAVQGSMSVLLDSMICALGPLMCLTNRVPELNGCPDETHASILDNIAYIMPGL